MRYKLGILEWRLRNAIDFSSVSAAEKTLYTEVVKILLDWSLLDPKTRIVLEYMLRIVFDYLNEK